MPASDEHDRIENAARSEYDRRIEVRLATLETRAATMEVDVAVIRSSFATKEDVQSLRGEIHASTERIMAQLYEQKIEFNQALAKQREDFFAALAKQRDEFNTALVNQRVELYKMQMSHTWKLYGFASLLMGGVYFIARYVH